MKKSNLRFSGRSIAEAVLSLVAVLTFPSLFSFDANAQMGPIQFHYENSGFQGQASTPYSWSTSEADAYNQIVNSPRYQHEGETPIGTLLSINQLNDLKELLDMIPRKSNFTVGDQLESGEIQNDPAYAPPCNGLNVAGQYGRLNVNFKIQSSTTAMPANTEIFGVEITQCNQTKDPVISAKITGNIGFNTYAPLARYHFKYTDLLVGESTGLQFKITDDNVQVLNAGADAFKVTKTGKVYAREFEVTLSAFPDYVFDKNYELLSLSEVDEYIQRHKHLPGMKTAEEYEAQGTINIGELQLKLVEKVEELTLHMIAQQKLIESQQKEIQALKNELVKNK